MPRSIDKCCAALLKPFLGFVEESEREDFLSALCPRPEEVERLFDSLNHPADLESWGRELLHSGLRETGLAGNGDAARDTLRHRLTGRLIAELLLPGADSEPGYRPANGNGRYWNVLFLAPTLEPVMLEMLDRGRKYPPKRGGERRVRDLAERFHAVIDGVPEAVQLQRMLLLWRLIMPFDKMAVRRGLAYRAFPKVVENIGASLSELDAEYGSELDRAGFDFVIARALTAGQVSRRLDQFEDHTKPDGTAVLQLSPEVLRDADWELPQRLTPGRAFAVELESTGSVGQVILEMNSGESRADDGVKLRRARIVTRGKLEEGPGPELRLTDELRELALDELISGADGLIARR